MGIAFGPGAARAQAVPATSATPAAVASPAIVRGGLRAAVDPAITRRAREWFQRMQTGNIDRTQLDATMNGILTDAKIKAVAAQLGPLGDPTDFTFLRKLASTGGTAYVYGATFKAHPAMWIFSLDGAAKINGLVIRPLDAPIPAGRAPKRSSM